MKKSLVSHDEHAGTVPADVHRNRSVVGSYSPASSNGHALRCATARQAKESDGSRHGIPRSAGRAVVRELLDRCLALFGLIALSPLIGVMLGLVRLTSRGPGLYSQTRLGLHGNHFRLYKIRTMHHQCEEHTGPVWSCDNDRRVTLLGKFLRALYR